MTAPLTQIPGSAPAPLMFVQCRLSLMTHYECMNFKVRPSEFLTKTFQIRNMSPGWSVDLLGVVGLRVYLLHAVFTR